MNLIESTRKKILNGNFLTADDLTQKEYELATDPTSSAENIFKLHDKLFGGNLRSLPHFSLDEIPHVCFDYANERELFLDSEDESEGGELIRLTPVLT